jgi:hypothetical protein
MMAYDDRLNLVRKCIARTFVFLTPEDSEWLAIIDLERAKSQLVFAAASLQNVIDAERKLR